ncbi:origin recognition complex subunit 1 isoform X2 [Mastacembelus armatus]|uniref:origin recognition complex subunit 1 isoform X2 n=1 Tax=Mastacembelus armatus TaxID=205130 RepID=UPI000E4546AC|nr:origin recognition complex subunit 1 isoform X2 [Mastacembelus armatus]
MKYFTRVRRVYRWRGEPVSFNRKLKTYDYSSLVIGVDGLPRTTLIITGQHILIEGEDEDSPYVAKVLRLFGDESGKQKKAAVQWFVRVSEVPPNKLKLLGREPHPQEIFYYQGRSCDDEVDVESILRPVQVKHLEGAAPFPDPDDTDTLYVKLAWDLKCFKLMDPELVPASSPPSHPKPSLPPSPPHSPPAAAPAPRGPSCRALPTPDPAVMHRAASGESRYGRATMSAGKAGAMEAESLHSATKLSASKCLSAKRRNASARTPGVRKKLELSSPEKMTPEDILGQLLDEERDVMLAQRLSSSPPQTLLHTHSLSPLWKAHRAPTAQDAIPLKRSTIVLDKLPVSVMDSPPSCARDDSTRAPTPSRKREMKPQREPALGVLAEVDDESSPALPAAFTPRTSKRKSAQLVSSRIRKQLNLLDNQQDLNSDGEDEDEFVPSRKELQISSSEEEEDAGLDSDDEVVVKRGRPAATHTPRSKQKSRSSARTPRKTPSKKKLTGHKATADHAASLLEKRFSNPAPRKESTVLLVDELDLLWTRKQNVMYNLFDWPTRRHARLVVLTIANTMDLPERIMINRVASRLGLTRMSFQPYSFKQLQQIIMSRLNKVKAFEEDALQLVSRKVAALSGDARRCLDICRRATEICEHSAAERSATGLVGMSHVMEALNEMFSSSYITAVKCASVHEQLFLRAVIAEFRRLGLEEATFQQVFVQHQALCRVEGLQPIGVSEGLAVCQRLGACRLLLLEPSRLGVLQRVRLNVSQDDVLYALKAD